MCEYLYAAFSLKSQRVPVFAGVSLSPSNAGAG